MERRSTKREKDMDFIWYGLSLVFSFAVETFQDKPKCKRAEATLEPSHGCRIVGPRDSASNKLSPKSPCHSAKTELLLDLLSCSTQVGPWVSLRLSSVQVQSDSLAVHFSSKPTDHCQITVILRGAVNLSKAAQGTFLSTLSMCSLEQCYCT